MDRRRWLSRIGAIVAFIVTLAFVGGLAFTLERYPRFMNTGIAECRASYGKAKSAADTTLIDFQRPSAGAEKKPNSETCGYWRKVGLTR